MPETRTGVITALEFGKVSAKLTIDGKLYRAHLEFPVGWRFGEPVEFEVEPGSAGLPPTVTNIRRRTNG